MNTTQWERLVETHGSEEAAKAYMATIGSQGGKKTPGTFTSEKARLAGIASGKARRAKKLKKDKSK